MQVVLLNETKQTITTQDGLRLFTAGVLLCHDLYPRQIVSFGTIENGDMLLNVAGQMVNDTWNEIPEHYPCFELDVCQIMPNHLHGIIVIGEVGAVPCGRPHFRPEEWESDENYINLKEKY